jgi:hypothetical protein
MKMTKIAFWRNILEVCLKSDKKESKYQCYAFISGACDCHDDCVPKINDMMCELATNTDHRCKSEVIKYAEKQIKRHEQKCKKKDHILDTTKKVEEPKPIKTVGIDNSDVTLALTAQHDPTHLQIAKMIRDNGYSCLGLNDNPLIVCSRCPLGKFDCGSMIDTANLQEMALRKKLIDDYIAEHTKPEPDNSVLQKIKKWYEEKKADFEESVKAGVLTDTIRIEHQTLRSIVKIIDHIEDNVPQPVKLPDFVYSASKNGVGFIDTKNRTFNTNDKGELLINDKPCFSTPEEALQVAKKLWNGEGK